MGLGRTVPKPSERPSFGVGGRGRSHQIPSFFVGPESVVGDPPTYSKAAIPTGTAEAPVFCATSENPISVGWATGLSHAAGSASAVGIAASELLPWRTAKRSLPSLHIREVSPSTHPKVLNLRGFRPQGKGSDAKAPKRHIKGWHIKEHSPDPGSSNKTGPNPSEISRGRWTCGRETAGKTSNPVSGKYSFMFVCFSWP